MSKNPSRPVFPCDVRAASDRQYKRQGEYEIPHENIEPMLPTASIDELPIEFDRILQAVEKVHPRAKSWVLAKLEGCAGVEIAADWGVTPVYVYRWECQFSAAIRNVFATYLDLPEAPVVELSKTHRSLIAA